MKTIWSFFLCSLICATGFSKPTSRPIPNEWVVKIDASELSPSFFQSLNTHTSLLSLAQTSLQAPLSSARLIQKESSQKSLILLVKTKASNGSLQIHNSPKVQWAYQNQEYLGELREEVELNDPKAPQQFHLEQLNLFNAWQFHWGSPEVVIAVTDDGFDLSHEDLINSYHRNPNEIPNNNIDDDGNGYVDDQMGWNFNQNNNQPDSDYSYGAHGTHVSGIIAATANNSLGVAGVAPGVKLMPLKFYGVKRFTSAIVLETYLYATDNGAKIISTSYNIDSMVNDPLYLQALEYAHNKGVLVFNSAGNDSSLNPPRSSLENLLLVASLTSGKDPSQYDKKSSFSNYGYQVDISAPGSKIYSTGRRNSYLEMSGTSMAAPIAAAVSGLIWSQDLNLSARQVLHKLLVSTEDIKQKNLRYIDMLGTGRPDAFLALKPEIPGLQIKAVEIEKPSSRTSGISEFHLRFFGAPENSTGEAFILTTNSDGSPKQIYRNLELQQEILMGTNQVKYSFPALPPGNYQLLIPEGSYSDPYQRPLDGDGDGIPGGDYRVSFKVK